jgi:peptide methionine sulfoxide reductase MsrB
MILFYFCLMDTLEIIKHVPADKSGSYPPAIIAINGQELISLVKAYEQPFSDAEGLEIAGAYQYLDIGYIYRQLTGTQLSNEKIHESKVTLLGCDCGFPGCWPLLCEVEEREDSIIWKEFEQPHRSGQWDYSKFGPFEFSKRDYNFQLMKLKPLDRESIEYIIASFTDLMTENERQAHRNFQLQMTLDHTRNQDEVYKNKITGMMKFNPEIKKLAEDGWPAFEERAAARLLAEHGERIYATTCTRCGKFPRTAKALQCYHCGHDWH